MADVPVSVEAKIRRHRRLSVRPMPGIRRAARRIEDISLADWQVHANVNVNGRIPDDTLGAAAWVCARARRPEFC